MQFNDDENEPLNKKGGGKRLGNVNETQNDQSTVAPESEGMDPEKKKKYIKWGIIGTLILIALTLAIVLPLTLGKGKGPEPTPPNPPAPPIDQGINFYSYGQVEVSRQSVQGVLVFNETTQSTSKISQYVSNLYQQNVEAVDPTITGEIGVNWKNSIKFSPNNPLTKNLFFQFEMVDMQVARLRLTDKDNTDRYQVPPQFVRMPQQNIDMRLEEVGHTLITKDSKDPSPFAFAFVDNTDDKNIFLTTEGQSLIFSDKYIQMDFVLPSRHCYGFGERQQQFELPEGAWGMWSTGSTDQSRLDPGLGRGGSYGVHPFIMVRTKNVQKYIGIYFRNSNAQVPILRYNTGAGALSSGTLSYITLGGQIEAYFFISGSAKQVIQSYQRMFGKPYLPPFWSLGWQEVTSQTYYDPTRAIEGDNQTTILNTIGHYFNESMPIESVYLDQKVYEQKRNFALNKTLIPNITDLQLLEQFMHIKLMGWIDPSIILPEDVSNITTENPYYVYGNDQDIFIKSSINPSSKYNSNLVGLKGLNKCVYLDWFNVDKVRTFWTQAITNYIQDVPFDGLWTQNNEATNDIQGELNLNQNKTPALERKLEQSQNQFDTNWFSSDISQEQSTYRLPFTPLFNSSGPFDVNAVSLNATHNRYLNQDNKTQSEYNLHSLYGHAMMVHTSAVINAISMSPQSKLHDKRPFLVTRSTFTGTGHFASYAIRSKYRTWGSLQNAIPRLMTMNMMGFTHSGVDVCGLIEDKDDKRVSMNEELCLRWIQLATFFPLARHSQDFSPANPYVTGPLGFKDEAKKYSAKLSMRDRMQFLRFMYTCLYESYEFGGTCIDSLVFHFPTDLNATNNINQTGVNDTFMFGGAVKVSPIVSEVMEGQKTFKSHFPKGRWVNLATLKVLDAQFDGLQDLPVDETTTVTKHLRPGYMIPWQNLNLTGDFYKNSTIDRVSQTEDLLKRPINLVINRDNLGTAQGTVFLDEGKTQTEMIRRQYEYYTITHKATKSIQLELSQGSRGFQDKTHSLDSIIIADAADLANTDFACGYTEDGDIIQIEKEFDNATQTLRLYTSKQSLDFPLRFSRISNIFYGSSMNKDLDLCSGRNFEYRLDPIFDNDTVFAEALKKPEVSMRLIHKVGALPDLNITLRVFDEGIINVRWTWPQNQTEKRQHFEIPDVVVNTSRAARGSDQIGRHVIIQRNPFSIQFTQQQGQTPAYFEIDNIIYDSYLNWVGMKAYSTYKNTDYKGVMGLGERSQQSLFYNDGIYSMWNFDNPPTNDIGVPPGDQGYSTHPFFMWPYSSNKWVGVFFKQAHAQDWFITNFESQGITQLKQAATGGITDIYVMVNSNSPDSVISYYHRIVGKPFLPPVWALGWHQSKDCLRTAAEHKDVVDKYNQYRIPLDVQWADHDYMDNYKDFTVDFKNFGNLTSYVKEFLKKNNTLKFVPILDAAIAYRENDGYRTFTEGRDKNVFLKSAVRNEIFQAHSWTNEAAFPDFFNPNTSDWWQYEITQFYKEMVEFDGLWLDKNEPSHFCNGPCVEKQRIINSMQNSFYYTPSQRSLEERSLPVDLKHYNGYTQLDTHNYFGTHQTLVTYGWFKDPKQNIEKKRPFIIERSSFPGLGKYAGKMLGQNAASYEDMQRSVTGTMMMNIFGIPFSGADICGYQFRNSTPNAQLCARWHQLGALQPFSRNHASCNSPRQDPGMFANETVPGLDNVTYMDIMKDAILTKYSLMRYLYTQMFQMSILNTNVGTLYKPLFFAFPNDPFAYAASPYENVMIGPSLKLSIKTTEVSNTVNETNTYYFPKGIWCDIINSMEDCVVSDGTRMIELKAGVKDYQLHLKDGEIIVYQNATEIQKNETKYQTGLRSENLQALPVDLHIHPTDTSVNRNKTIIYTARGTYINDNGLEPEVSRETYNEYSIVFTYNDEVNNSTNDEYIRLTVGLNNNATRYYSNETKCSNINMNDMLGRIYIYDELGFFKHNSYVLGLVKPDLTYDQLGLAKFDPLTNRLVYDPDSIQNRGKDTPQVICMSNIEEIDFLPLPM